MSRKECLKKKKGKSKQIPVRASSFETGHCQLLWREKCTAKTKCVSGTATFHALTVIGASRTDLCVSVGQRPDPKQCTLSICLQLHGKECCSGRHSSLINSLINYVYIYIYIFHGHSSNFIIYVNFIL